MIGTHATTVARDSAGVLRVTYHSTPIVTWYPGGKLVLNHGGWMSMTTKRRMNQASEELGLGYSVYQQDFDWYVDVDGNTLKFENEELVIRNG